MLAGALPGLPGSAVDPGTGPAELAALDALLDDGSLEAVGSDLAGVLAAHRALSGGSHRDLVAALVLPAGSAHDLSGLLTPADLGLRVLLAADGPAALDALLAARSALIDENWVDVTGLRLPIPPAAPTDAVLVLESLLTALHASVPSWITLPPGTPPAVLDVIAQDGAENVTVDLATGDAEAVAGLVRALVDRELTFRVTGAEGVLRGPEGGAPGVLNVLCAVRAALNGAETAELAAVLRASQTATLTSAVRRMSAADAAVTRAFLAAVQVSDPSATIAGLIRLGLIDADPDGDLQS